MLLEEDRVKLIALINQAEANGEDPAFIQNSLIPAFKARHESPAPQIEQQWDSSVSNLGIPKQEVSPPLLPPIPKPEITQEERNRLALQAADPNVPVEPETTMPGITKEQVYNFAEGVKQPIARTIEGIAKTGMMGGASNLYMPSLTSTMNQPEQKSTSGQIGEMVGTTIAELPLMIVTGGVGHIAAKKVAYRLAEKLPNLVGVAGEILGGAGYLSAKNLQEGKSPTPDVVELGIWGALASILRLKGLSKELGTITKLKNKIPVTEQEVSTLNNTISNISKEDIVKTTDNASVPPLGEVKEPVVKQPEPKPEINQPLTETPVEMAGQFNLKQSGMTSDQVLAFDRKSQVEVWKGLDKPSRDDLLAKGMVEPTPEELLPTPVELPKEKVSESKPLEQTTIAGMEESPEKVAIEKYKREQAEKAAVEAEKPEADMPLLNNNAVAKSEEAQGNLFNKPKVKKPKVKIITKEQEVTALAKDLMAKDKKGTDVITPGVGAIPDSPVTPEDWYDSVSRHAPGELIANGLLDNIPERISKKYKYTSTSSRETVDKAKRNMETEFINDFFNVSKDEVYDYATQTIKPKYTTGMGSKGRMGLDEYAPFSSLSGEEKSKVVSDAVKGYSNKKVKVKPKTLKEYKEDARKMLEQEEGRHAPEPTTKEEYNMKTGVTTPFDEDLARLAKEQKAENKKRGIEEVYNEEGDLVSRKTNVTHEETEDKFVHFSDLKKQSDAIRKDIAINKLKEANVTRKLIYEYERSIGLDKEARNRVDTLLRDAKKIEDYVKAVDIMDEVLYKKKNRGLVRQVGKTIKKETDRLAEAEKTVGKSSMSYKQNMQMKEYIDNLTNVSKDREAKLERTQKWFEDNPDQELPDNILEDITSLSRKNIVSMTNEELVGVLRDIQQIKKLGSLKRKLEKAKAQEEFDALVSDSKEEMGVGKIDYVKNAIKNTNRNKLLRGLGSLAENLKWSNIRPERILDIITGYKNKVFKKAIQDPLYKASEKMVNGLESRTKKLKEINKDINPGKALTETFTELHGEKITYNNGMFIYANTKNPDNYAHLLGTGLTEKEIEGVVDALPTKYKIAVDNMIKDYDEVQWKRMNEQFKKEHYVDMPKADGYFPISNLVTDWSKNAVYNDLLNRMGTKTARVEKGMTKTRTGSDSPFGKMDYFGTVTKNILDSERYLAYSDAVGNARKLLNNKEIKEAINSISPQAYFELDDWLKAVAYGKERSTGTALDKLSDWLRNNYVTSTIGFLATTVLKQTASIPVGIANTSTRHVLRAARSSLKGPFALNDFINSKSGMMKSRATNFERELAEQHEGKFVKNMLGVKGPLEKTKELSMVPTVAIDKASANIVWMAKYTEMLEKTGNEDIAIKLADEVVRKTQSLGGILYSPRAFRGGGISRGYSTFLNQPNQMLNLTIDLAKEWKVKPTRENLTKVFAYYVAPSLMTYYVGQGLDWRKIKKDPVGVAEEAITSVTSGMPLIGQIVAVALNKLANEARKKLDIPTQNKAYISLIPTSFEFLDDAKTMIASPSIKKGVGLAGKVTGLPTSQGIRIAENVKESIKEKSVKPLIFSKSARRSELESDYVGVQQRLKRVKDEYKKLHEEDKVKASLYKNKHLKELNLIKTDNPYIMTIGKADHEISEHKKAIEKATKEGKNDIVEKNEEVIMKIKKKFVDKLK